MSTTGNGGRFLRAFQTIEGALRKSSGAGPGSSFSEMLRRAAQSNHVVRRYEKDLEKLRELRNAIVHDEDLLAEPTEKAVELAERIAEHLQNPPRVEQCFCSPVLSVPPDAPVAEAVRLMYEHDYSQGPVVQDGWVVNLLTANTIARWLGALAAEEVFSVEETWVEEVLGYAEQAKRGSASPGRPPPSRCWNASHITSGRGGDWPRFWSPTPGNPRRNRWGSSPLGTWRRSIE